MIKGAAQLVRGLMLFLLCGCTALSASNANELNKVHGRSTGCGKIQSGNGNYLPIKIRVLDQDRTYHLRVPTTYDPNHAYPLVFRWHGYGGNGLSGGMDIEFSSGNDAIVVGADGINKYWGLNEDPINLLFFDRMLETISNQYCIDRDRVFSYGFSGGGFFTNMLACERGDVLRASAAVASGLRGGYRKGKVATWIQDALGSNGAVMGGNNCKGKVASWFLHDLDDNTVPIAKGKAARERALAINGCSSNTVDEGDGCVHYQDCGAAPVVWCESKGFGHNIRGDFAPAQVWKFFQNLH